MESQTPAEGILVQNDWGDSKIYYVACECTEPDHSHTVDVEADDYGVTVNIHIIATNTTSRWRSIWQLLTKGYTAHEASIMLRDQQAVNYAEALKSAAADVKTFKQQQAKARSNK